MKIKIIQLLCLLVILGCQKNDIEVFNGANTNLANLNGNWVVINYWADWCAPCKQLTPILESLVKSYKGQLKLVKIDTEKNQELSQQLQIQSLPTVYAFYEGQPIDGFSGAMPENEVKKFINKVIEASGGNKLEEFRKAIEEAEKLYNEEDFDFNVFRKHQRVFSLETTVKEA